MTEQQMKRVRVKDGRRVPNPDTGLSDITSDPEGELVRASRFVDRRIADGDLEEVTLVEVELLVGDEPAAAPAEPAATTDEAAPSAPEGNG